MFCVSTTGRQLAETPHHLADYIKNLHIGDKMTFMTHRYKNQADALRNPGASEPVWSSKGRDPTVFLPFMEFYQDPLKPVIGNGTSAVPIREH